MWSISALLRRNRSEENTKTFDEIAEGHSDEEISKAIFGRVPRGAPNYRWANELRRKLRRLPATERNRLEGSAMQREAGHQYGQIADLKHF